MAEADSDEDLTKELQPLAYHVSDRKRVLKEALKALKGKRLDAMIPPVLKTWDRSRIEYACLEILEDVDDDTLLAILDGQVSTAGVSAVEQLAAPIKPSGGKLKNSKLKKKLAKAVENAEDADEPKKKKKKKAVLVADQDGIKAAKLKKKKKLAKAKVKEKAKKKKKAAAAAEVSEEAPAPHKSLMELLELEYRAKAIKALLRSQGQSVPDIPINIDSDSNSNAEKPVVAVTEVEKSQVHVNGECKSTTKAPSAQEPKPKIKTTNKKITLDPVISAPLVEKASMPSPSKPAATPLKKKKMSNTQSSSQKAAQASQATSSNSQNTQPAASPTSKGKEQPKKQVIDLIDEALNTSFSEETDAPPVNNNNDLIKPPSVIVEACTRKDIDTDALRAKLLKKMQTQKQTQRKRKKKKATEPEEQEDILDLHPQELNLTDEDRTGPANTASCTENESESEYSSDEDSEAEEEKGTVRSSNPNSITEQASQRPLKSGSEKVSPPAAASAEEEELIYDEDSQEDQEEAQEKENWSQIENMEMEKTDNDVNCDDDVNDYAIVVRNKSNINKGEDNDSKIVEDETVMSDASDEIKSPEEPPGENSRLGMFSETTRDDVFESARDRTTVFNNQSLSLKRKITFRIDPARIGKLEEEGAEEEAKKAEERKKQEEERRREEEERAKEMEIEEGEVDSNEEEELAKDKSTSPSPKSWRDREASQKSKVVEEDLRNLLRKKHEKKSRVESDVESDDSQDSTSVYTRRPYRRTTRLDHSPSKQHLDDVPKKAEVSPQQRPASPVEFISHFSDMEDISDDDSDHSVGSSKTKKLSVKKSENSAAKVAENTAVASASVVVSTVKEKIISSVNDSDDEAQICNPSEGLDNNLNKNEDSQASAATSNNEKEEEDEEETATAGDAEDDLPKPVTWYERWANSHGMQKVVKTNKIHKKVRTKLRQVTSSKKKPIELPKNEPSIEEEPIIGSIQEYEKLFGKTVIKEVETPTDNTDTSTDVQGGNNGDNDEDEDADDLWGDILGGS